MPGAKDAFCFSFAAAFAESASLDGPGVGDGGWSCCICITMVAGPPPVLGGTTILADCGRSSGYLRWMPVVGGCGGWWTVL